MKYIAKKSPKKSLGQYFLIAPQTIKKIVDTAFVSKEDTVLEIGPGRGALTRELLLRGAKVVAVEKDGELIEKLTKTFGKEIDEGFLKLIHDDILLCDFDTLGLTDKKYKVVANIPYYITGILIRTLLTNSIQPNTIVLIVQKEIAERISKDIKESLLSLSVKAYGTPRYMGTIKRGAFRPSPRVASAILLIKNISRDFFADISEETFFKLLKVGFSSKRKQVLNNLEKVEDKKILLQIFKKLNINPKIRAEDLSLQSWKKIVESI